MWIKICANTNLQDAALAAERGADAVGFVFARSKRQVTAEQVVAITAELPNTVERVGVFTDSSPEAIARTVQLAGLDAVQMHGPLDGNRLLRVRELLPDTAVIPVLHWDVANANAAVHQVLGELRRVADLVGRGKVLLDAKVGAQAGGTGVALDWEAAKAVFQEAENLGIQLILAGGLRPENVEEAIRATGAWGVDVASGVESSPGRKDPARLEMFLRKAHGG